MKEVNQVFNCTASNLKMASRVVTQHFDRHLKPMGLRGTQFTLLSTIAQMGRPTITGLAEQMIVDRTTLTRNLAPMEKAGFLVSIDGEDRRIRYVALTDNGKEQLAEATLLWQDAQRSLVDKIGGDEWNGLLVGLGLITTALQE